MDFFPLLVVVLFLSFSNSMTTVVTSAAGPFDPWIVPNASVPWITDVNQPGHACINIISHYWGLGSLLNSVWWSITMAKALNPDVAIYYDHNVRRSV